MTRDSNTGRFTNRPQRAWEVRESAQSESSCLGMQSSLGTAIAVASGAAIGAGLMFLLDPQAGSERRHAARQAAAHAIDATSNALGSTWESVSDSAHDAAEHLTPDRSTRKSFRRGLGRLTGALGSASDDAGDTASSWLDSARSHLPSLPSRRSMRRSGQSWLDSAKEYLPARQTGASASTVGLTAAGCIAAGLGAMYLMDPDRGRGRRAWIGQKATRFLNETGSFMRATGRHLSNKSKGYAHKGRRMAAAGVQSLSDSGVAESVRSALGKLGLRREESVGVNCEDGCVTLTGICVADDVDNILNATRNVYGVVSIRNDMNVSDRYPAGTQTQF
jgi:hypothetical protein